MDTGSAPRDHRTAPHLPVSEIGDDLGLGIAIPGSRLIDAEGHRKVHPISPLVHAAAVFPAVAGVAFALSVSGSSSLLMRIEGLPGVSLLPPVLAGVLALTIVAALISIGVAGYQYLAWRALSFWFDEDGDFRVRSGVVFRNERRVQVSRIQTVDVMQPLAARLFSMAVLIIEVAGQSDSRVRLRFLTLADAREIRREVLARSAGLAAETIEAPQDLVTRVPANRLAASLLLRASTVGLAIITALIIAFSYVTEGWSGIALAAVTGGVPLIIIVSEFLRYYGFTVAQSPDGLRLRYGLLRTESRTVPPGRVQAIDYVEPLLWRRLGWARVRVTIAGVGTQTTSSSNEKETLLIPVAPRTEAHDVVSRVLPDLDTTTLTWVVAPRRSWRRSPIQWRNLAVGWDEHMFATRRGRITRHLAAVPHARTQSVRLTQGPWERALGLASIHVDTAPGPVDVSGLHLDATDAHAIAEHQAVAARLRRHLDRSTFWARDHGSQAYDSRDHDSKAHS